MPPPDAPAVAPAGHRAWVSTTFRFLLAAVWAAAAVSNLANRDAAARSLLAYRLLSHAQIPPVVGGLAAVEIGLVVLLGVGLSTRAAALVSAVLLAVFVGAIASAWARGLQPDCRCPGSGSAFLGPVVYVKELVRDTAFMAMAAWLIVVPTSRLAVATAFSTHADGPAGPGP